MKKCVLYSLLRRGDFDADLRLLEDERPRCVRERGLDGRKSPCWQRRVYNTVAIRSRLAAYSTSYPSRAQLGEGCQAVALTQLRTENAR